MRKVKLESGPITAHKCAELIRKKFNPKDYILIYNEQPDPPYEEGWAIDSAEKIIKALENPDIFSFTKRRYRFVVGLIKIDTNTNQY